MVCYLWFYSSFFEWFSFCFLVGIFSFVFFLLSSSVNFCSYGFLSCFCFCFSFFILFDLFYYLWLLTFFFDILPHYILAVVTSITSQLLAEFCPSAFCFFLFVFFLFLYFLLTLYLSIFMKFVANEYWYVYTRTLWRWQLVCRALNVANSCCCSVLRWHDCTNPRCRHNR